MPGFPPPLPKSSHLQNLTQKLQGFKGVLELDQQVNGEMNNNSFKWLQKRAKCDLNGIKIAILLLKTTKNRLVVVSFAPRLPSVMPWSSTSLLVTFPYLNIF